MANVLKCFACGGSCIRRMFYNFSGITMAVLHRELGFRIVDLTDIYYPVFHISIVVTTQIYT